MPHPAPIPIGGAFDGEILETGGAGLRADGADVHDAGPGRGRAMLVGQLCQRRVMRHLPSWEFLPDRRHGPDSMPRRHLLHDRRGAWRDLPDRVFLPVRVVGLYRMHGRILLSARIGRHHRLPRRQLLSGNIGRHGDLHRRALLPIAKQYADAGDRRDLYCGHRRDQSRRRTGLSGRELLRSRDCHA